MTVLVCMYHTLGNTSFNFTIYNYYRLKIIVTFFILSYRCLKMFSGSREGGGGAGGESPPPPQVSSWGGEALPPNFIHCLNVIPH